jgi:hypothetical protein
MQELMSNPIAAQAGQAPSENHGPFSRRNFVKGMALMAGTLLVKPSLALPRANPAAASYSALLADPFSAYVYEGDAWKWTIISLTNQVCAPEAAHLARETIERCYTTNAPTPSDFHQSYAAPVILVGERYSPVSAGCTQFFELDRFPYYDRSNPCARIKDLNAYEIRRLIYPAEVSLFGCVMNPCSLRHEPDARAEVAFEHTARERYGTDPRNLNLNYVRYYNNGKPHYGFGVSSKHEVGPNGKPMSDLLLSSEDV